MTNYKIVGGTLGVDKEFEEVPDEVAQELKEIVKEEEKEVEFTNESGEKSMRPKDFLRHYVKPHKKVSRLVTDGDLVTVVRDSHILYNLCFTAQENMAGAYAVAHPQINDEDPLRFFVIADKQIIINPVIVRHTRHAVKSTEGCTSFPKESLVEVDRYNKIEVTYQTLTADGKLSDVEHRSVGGKMARVFQHEINHLDAQYIYEV